LRLLGLGGPVGGFLGLVGVLFRGLYCITGVINGGFYCIVEVTIMLVRGFLVGSLWVFLGFLCGLVGLLFCIFSVYLWMPYAFF
jgi:hypothetical protein